ncbi:hypothetical protein B0H14DRAFT_2647567 [Mycena olivaceomarginata]|nr:hypothetical protein B0H14DRAFT_2647567 [Mycena olivaceomarginata]
MSQRLKATKRLRRSAIPRRPKKDPKVRKAYPWTTCSHDLTAGDGIHFLDCCGLTLYKVGVNAGEGFLGLPRLETVGYSHIGWMLVKPRRKPGVADVSDLPKERVRLLATPVYIPPILPIGFDVLTIIPWLAWGNARKATPMPASCIYSLCTNPLFCVNSCPLILSPGFIHDVGCFIDECPGGAHTFSGDICEQSNTARNVRAAFALDRMHARGSRAVGLCKQGVPVQAARVPRGADNSHPAQRVPLAPHCYGVDLDETSAAASAHLRRHSQTPHQAQQTEDAPEVKNLEIEDVVAEH